MSSFAAANFSMSRAEPWTISQRIATAWPIWLRRAGYPMFSPNPSEAKHYDFPQL
jgi:hypothetical protein